MASTEDICQVANQTAITIHLFEDMHFKFVLVLVILGICINIFHMSVMAKTLYTDECQDILTFALSISNVLAIGGILNSVLVPVFGGVCINVSLGYFVQMSVVLWQFCIILCIAVERYIAIIKPLHYPMYITRRRLLLMVCGSGVASFLYGLIMILLRNRTVRDAYAIAVIDNRQSLTPKDLFTDEVIHYLYSIIAICLVIASTVVVLYVPILVTIRRQTKGKNGDEHQAKKYRGTIMLSVVIIYIFVVWLGYFIILATPAIRNLPLDDTGPTAVLGKILLYMCSSTPVVNPLLYGLCNRRFWNMLKQCCKCCMNGRIHPPNTTNTVNM